jgi:TonB family protein
MIFLLSLFLSLSSTLIPQSKLNVNEFLPAGAKLETQVTNPVLADFDGDGLDDAVLFFTLGEIPNRTAWIVVLKQTPVGFKRMWSWSHTGAMGFSDPSGVRRIDGKPLVLANVEIGARAVDFQAFRYEDGAMQPASPVLGSSIGPTFEDINRDGHLELLAPRYPPLTDLDDVYRWDGAQFVCSNAQYADHYAAMLAGVTAAARSRTPMNGSERLTKVAEAMEIDLYTKRFNDGIDLANWALAAFDDANLAGRTSFPEQEKAKGKAIIYYLEGMLYQGEAEMEKAAAAFANSRRLLPTSLGRQSLMQGWFLPHPGCSALDADAVSLPELSTPAIVSASALTAPKPTAPADGAALHGFPRTTTLQWTTVPNAVSYGVEIDCFHCCKANQWCTDIGGASRIERNLRQPVFTFDFVGDQPGRWRVWAIDQFSREGPKSAWSNFTYGSPAPPSPPRPAAPAPVAGPGARFSPPSVLQRVEPDYTDAARAAKIQGTVVMECVIHKDGTVMVNRIIRGLGYGLDENARATIEKWRFNPATRDGQPVDMTLTIEVNFNLQ